MDTDFDSEIIAKARNSSVIIVTRLYAARPWIRYAAEARDCPLSKKPKWVWGQPSYSLGNGALYQRVKRPGRKTVYSPPSTARLKKEQSLHLHSP
jgi:hypothetical protein